MTIFYLRFYHHFYCLYVHQLYQSGCFCHLYVAGILGQVSLGKVIFNPGVAILAKERLNMLYSHHIAWRMHSKHCHARVKIVNLSHWQRNPLFFQQKVSLISLKGICCCCCCWRLCPIWGPWEPVLTHELSCFFSVVFPPPHLYILTVLPQGSISLKRAFFLSFKKINK